MEKDAKHHNAKCHGCAQGVFMNMLVNWSGTKDVLFLLSPAYGPFLENGCQCTRVSSPQARRSNYGSRVSEGVSRGEVGNWCLRGFINSPVVFCCVVFVTVTLSWMQRYNKPIISFWFSGDICIALPKRKNPQQLSNWADQGKINVSKKKKKKSYSRVPVGKNVTMGMQHSFNWCRINWITVFSIHVTLLYPSFSLTLSSFKVHFFSPVL